MDRSSLPRGGTTSDTASRRKLVEKKTGVKLKHTSSHSFEPESASRNVENFIGVTQIPLGIAGPLRVRGEYARGDFFIPLATTEAALVATINRGCSVVTESGGALVRVTKDAMTRAPVFRTEGIEHGILVSEWVSGNFRKLQAVARSTTRHGRLLSAATSMTGKTLFVRFSFSTGDAMGMNMATIASQKMCDLIERETGAKTISVSGNMCVDKKPSAMNFIEGRGKTVLAEAVIPERIVKTKLHSTSAEIVDTSIRKNMTGSAMSLSYGFNSHFANMAAAMFIATGQDAAQVVEASMGISLAEKTDGGLYMSVRLPALEVGTVGGGTSLPTQAEALRMIGCSGSGYAVKLAEIMGSVILSGELSTLAAQSKGELAAAHARMAR